MIAEELDHKLEQACDLIKSLLNNPNDPETRKVCLSFLHENHSESIDKYFILTEFIPEKNLGF